MVSTADPQERPDVRTARRRGAPIGLDGAAVIAAVAVFVVGLVMLWPSPRQEVVLLGDSITVPFDLADDLTVAGKPTQVEAAPGLRVSDAYEAVPAISERRPSDLVVNLGTNDLFTGRSPQEAVDDLERLVDTIGPPGCVHVVTVNEQMVLVDRPDLDAVTAEFNQLLRARAELHGWALVDWARVVEDHEADDEAPAATVDTVHPSLVGLALLAEAIERSVANGCP